MNRTEYKCELTNLVMIQDPHTGRVLTQNRVFSWKGYTFPGGHVERGESFYEAAVREVREETGLTVNSLTLCGIVHWENADKPEKYLVFLYRTDDFSGRVKANEEGELSWVTLEELKTLPLSNNFERHLEIFLSGNPHESYALYGEGRPDSELIIY